MKNCDVKILNNIKYKNIVRWWLTFLLCLVPVQFYVSKQAGLWNSNLFNVIRQIGRASCRERV